MRARRNSWFALVPLVALGAGLMFATSAETAKGTDLRAGRQAELSELIEAQQRRTTEALHQAATLRQQVAALSEQQSSGSGAARTANREAAGLAMPAGLQAARGPGITVTLSDAPPPKNGQLPPGVSPNDVVVHQQDVQAVVNALWAGGAEAMQLMDQRVISTSAVRCVGNTLLLQGVVYSPPYTITAIGDVGAMKAALAESPGVLLYKEYADLLGLVYKEQVHADVKVPAYTGPVALHYARPVS